MKRLFELDIIKWGEGCYEGTIIFQFPNGEYEKLKSTGADEQELTAELLEIASMAMKSWKDPSKTQKLTMDKVNYMTVNLHDYAEALLHDYGIDLEEDADKSNELYTAINDVLEKFSNGEYESHQ